MIMGKNTDFILIIIAIIAIIAVIFYVKDKGNNEITPEIMQCIAGKSHLYISSTCSHCEQQKEILSDYLNLFNVTDCVNNLAICNGKDIKTVPTWIINEGEYLGVKSLKELKALASC